MARYNDYVSRSDVCKVCLNKGIDCGKEKCPVNKAPTADVVPKSEVEKYKNALMGECALTSCPMKVELKAEVAREIFEEIEKEIDTGLSVIEKILNAKGGRANGKTVLISKYDVFIEAKKHLTKLKKKYTEEE